MIKGFIFDLDGVIVDTAVFHYKAWRKLANKMGFDIDLAFNETLKGISRMDSLEAILKLGKVHLSEAEKTEMANLKNSWYLEQVNQMNSDEILPGIIDFIQKAKTDNIKIALGSASKNSALILEKTGILHFFDVLVDGNKVSKSKPDPEVFFKGALELDLLPHNCVVFEDAFAGVQAAKAANMKAVGIGNISVLNNADIVYKDLVGVTPQMIIEKLS